MAERIGLDAVRELMRRYLDEDGDKRSVEAEGNSLEDALKNASVQLDCPVSSLEYEVLEKGGTGFMGIVKKPWKINVYESSGKKKLEVAVDEGFDTGIEIPSELVAIVRDKIGRAHV